MGGEHSCVKHDLFDAYESAFITSHNKINRIEREREGVNNVCSNKTSVELLNLTLMDSMVKVNQLRTVPAPGIGKQFLEDITPVFTDFCAKQETPAREPTVNAFFDKAVAEQKETFWQSVMDHHKSE